MDRYAVWLRVSYGAPSPWDEPLLISEHQTAQAAEEAAGRLRVETAATIPVGRRWSVWAGAWDGAYPPRDPTAVVVGD